MSNSAVGATYAAVIQKVLELSENDFLENGVEQSVLQDLKENWQTKLTNLHVAHFPWDPPPPAPVQPPTVPSNVPKSETPPSAAAAQPPPQPAQQQQQQQPQQTGNYGNVRIKTEPGYEQPPNPGYPQQNGAPAYSSGLDRGIAAQRAAALMEREFGPQAAPAIAGMHARSNIALPGQRPPSHMGLQLPGQNQQQPRMQNGLPQQQPQQQQRPQAYPSQTDGADELDDADNALQQWRALVAERRAQAEDGPAGRHVADGMFRQQLEDLVARMDSGLLIPLDEVPSAKAKALKRKLRARAAAPPASGSSSSVAPQIPQLDGDYDDDDDDKKDIPDDELINSDLDDSEDEIARDDDEETDIGDMMLCTYDKVQRVKNKWKCTLKDGILTTNGKDYLFHKATGEFEW